MKKTRANSPAPHISIVLPIAAGTGEGRALEAD